MFVKKIPTSLNLLSVKLKAKRQVKDSGLRLLLNDRWIPNPMIVVLPAGKGRAHRRADEEQQPPLRQQFFSALAT